MSRRKQSNPKPFNKGDCSDTTEEMTVDSRDSKDLNAHELSEEQMAEPNHDNQQQQQQISANEDNAQTLEETEVNAAAASVSVASLDDAIEMRESPARSDHDKCAVEERRSATPPGYDHSSDQPSTPIYKRSPSSGQRSATQTPVDEAVIEIEYTAKLEQPDTPPPTAVHSATPSPEPNAASATTPSPSTTPATTPGTMPLIPKLRLNALLASDPALKPDAKELILLQDDGPQQQPLPQKQPLPAPPPLTKQQDTELPLRTKVFMCHPCGIGFSSPSTLEAHQAYYCSHRNNKDGEEQADGAAGGAAGAGDKSTSSGSPAASGVEPVAKAPRTGKQYACTQCSYSADKKVSLNRHMRMHQSSPAPSNAAAAAAAAANGATGGVGLVAGFEDGTSQQVDRYCSDCDIRFNNVKTYRAHKQHYCSSRRTDAQLMPKLEVTTAAGGATTGAGSNNSSTVGGNKTPLMSSTHSPQTISRNKTPTPAMVAAAAAAAAAAAVTLQPPPQPFLALPTNPIIIVPYALIRTASLIPGPLTTSTTGIVNPETTCFTLENGTLKPLATALNLNALSANVAAAAAVANNNAAAPPAPPAPSSTPNSVEINQLSDLNAGRNMESNEGKTLKRKEPTGRESTAPLDLSLRRSPINALLQRHAATGAGNAFLDAVEHQQHLQQQQRLKMEALLEASKENLVLDEAPSRATPEQIVCAPSLPNSPSLSPSPKRRAISPRSSGAGSTSSMSPPATNVSANYANLLDSLPLRSMLPADFALKLSESNIMNPLLAKQNLELALKFSAAAAAAANNSVAGSASTSPVMPTGTSPAELAAAAVVAAGKLGLPVPPVTAASPAAAVPPTQPQIYVKQGVSKCKECNIVFCKYENYLAHKQHYCSARNQDVSDGGSDSKISLTPPMAGGGGVAAAVADTTPVAYQQLICAACGIKYTSLDNLRAHQNYYCPKGGGAAAAAAAAAAAVTAASAATASAVETSALPQHSKEKCNKCKTQHEFGLPCPPPPLPPTSAHQQQPQQQQHSQPMPTAGAERLSGSSSANNVNKCPVCGVVSLTATFARKHMETHGTVKAFRCTICLYKGNTLRGMRTHIRTHYDKKSSDINEEHYMTCIFEEDGMEVPTAAAATLQHQQQQQQQQEQQQQLMEQQKQLQHAAAELQMSPQHQQLYNCDACSYVTTYKGNLLRHIKLMHPQLGINSSPSISPEVGEHESNDTASSLNGDNNMPNFSIKSEPLDHATGLGHHLMHHDNNNSPISTPTPTPALQLHEPHIKAEPLDIPSMDTVNAQPPPPTAEALQKYCSTCDISFTYVKTYLAHKQFYCKSKIQRDVVVQPRESPSPHAMSALSAPKELMLQKNKENLQQEAAI